MTHHPVIQAGIGRDRSTRRWSPRLGYALAVSGSALVWAAVVLGVSALI